jgi:hypothetical protein
MRDYSKVSGQFWTGKTGKSLRGDMQAQLVAVYLMTSPHANMIGVFHCPIIYIAHEIGCPIEGATKGLKTLCEGGFCTYDEDTETVWVHEMAKFQIDEQLKPADRRVSGIQKLYENMPEGHIKTGFFEKYRESFLLVDNCKNSKPLTSPLQAPTKPEAGTGTETEIKTLPSPVGDNSLKKPSFRKPDDVSESVWADFLTVRKAKKAPVTESGMAGIRREAAKANISLEDALRISVERNWQGFRADWYVPPKLAGKEGASIFQGAL